MGILQIRRESGPPTIYAGNNGQLYLDTLDNVVYVSNDSEWVRVSIDIDSIMSSQTSSMSIISSSYSITSSYSLSGADAIDITTLATTGSNIFTGNQIISQSSSKAEIGAFTSSFDGDVIISGSMHISNGLYAIVSNSLYTATASYSLNGLDSIDLSVFAITGSNIFNGNQIITSSLIVNNGNFYTSNDGIINGPLTINSSESLLVDVDSVIIMSNDTFNNSNTLAINANTLITGSVNITGSLLVSGSITGLINSASYAVTASFMQNILSSSYSLSSSYIIGIDGSDGYISKFSGSNKVISSIMKEISPAIWTYGNQTITGSMSIGKELIVEGTGSNVLTGDLSVGVITNNTVILSSTSVAGSSIKRVFHTNPLSEINGFPTWSFATTQPLGNYVYDMAVSGNLIVAATWGAGAYKSTNNGLTWSAANTGIATKTFASIMFSGSVIFAGVNDLSGYVCKSVNGGISWTSSSYTSQSEIAFALSYIQNSVFVGGQRGIFKSIDGGNSWTPATGSMAGSKIIQCLRVSASALIAGMDSTGIYISYDTGSTWTQYNTGLTNLSVVGLCVSASVIFAGTTGGGIFKSTTYGQSWTAINTGLTNLYVRPITFIDDVLITGTQNGIWISSDGGQLWKSYYVGSTHLSLLPLLSSSICQSYGGMTVAKNLVLNPIVPPPVSVASSGDYGRILFDNNYIYVCTGSNSWKRIELSNW